MSRTVDLTGKPFGMLTVESFHGIVGTPPRTARAWFCRCKCGGTSIVPTDRLMSGNTKSCGCLKREAGANSRRTHGKSGSPEYETWCRIKERCNNPNNPRFSLYGGRGITICDEWNASYEAFFAYVGLKPSPKHSIDCIDNNRGYEPGNVRWATQKTQTRNNRRNVRIEYDGKTLTLTEWAEHFGVEYYRLHGIIKNGRTLIDAVQYIRSNPIKAPVGRTPQSAGKRAVILTLNGETLSVTEWASRLNVSRDVLFTRHRDGWTDEETLTTPIKKQSNSKFIDVTK